MPERRWRVTARGPDTGPGGRDPDAAGNRDEAAHRRLHELAPGTPFGTTSSGAEVTADLVVWADGSDEAEATARSLLEQALPTVAFEYAAEPEPGADDRRRRYEPPNCGFCGKSKEQVARIVIGPRFAICDECVEMLVEAIREPT